jgi:hypothetical protein
MKKSIYVLLCLFSISFLSVHKAFGQSDDPVGNYVMLYSGKLIKCKTVYHQSSLIITDAAKYDEDDVQFFKSGDILYGNTRKFSWFKKSSNFLQASITGKINVFIERTTTYSRNQNGGSTTNTSTTVYYNKGFGDLNYTKPKLLKKDMAGNAECLKIIKKVRTRSIVGGTMQGIALLVIPLGIYQYDTDDESGGKILAEVVAAIGLYALGALITKDEEDNILKAIAIYNSGR